MADLELKQVHSASGSSPKQRGALETLKLGRIGRSSTMADTPQLRGVLAQVGHLVEVNGVAPVRGFTKNPSEL